MCIAVKGLMRQGAVRANQCSSDEQPLLSLTTQANTLEPDLTEKSAGSLVLTWSFELG